MPSAFVRDTNSTKSKKIAFYRTAVRSGHQRSRKIMHLKFVSQVTTHNEYPNIKTHHNNYTSVSFLTAVRLDSRLSYIPSDT